VGEDTGGRGLKSSGEGTGGFVETEKCDNKLLGGGTYLMCGRKLGGGEE